MRSGPTSTRGSARTYRPRREPDASPRRSALTNSLITNFPARIGSAPDLLLADVGRKGIPPESLAEGDMPEIERGAVIAEHLKVVDADGNRCFSGRELAPRGEPGFEIERLFRKSAA